MADRLGKIKRTYQIPQLGDDSCSEIGDVFIWEWDNGKYGYSINTTSSPIEYDTEEQAVEAMASKARKNLFLGKMSLENQVRKMEEVIINLRGEKGKFDGSYGDDEYRTSPKAAGGGIFRFDIWNNSKKRY